ncbi:PD40 domain-containing protein [candidate division WOR-3 bacterium]|nr:PD40 domain-containing protein [candidate division WOR-3 bacterium]
MKNLILTSILTCSAAIAAGYWSEPVKLPEAVNQNTDSLWDRYHAHISPDGKEMYFSLHNSSYDDDIYVARWKGGNEWDSVTRLSVNMNDVRRELSPSITADHSKLFWCAWNRPGGYGGYDVWYAEWDSVAGDWGEPQNAGPNANTPGYEFTCFISADGKTLYVSSTYDSYGEDLYKLSWQDSCWGPRERVFEELHLWGDQYDAWVTADGRWLYLSQIVYVPHGWSSYRSHWEGEYFGEPEWLGPPVCLPGEHQWNESPSLTPDGSRLYFSSNRPDSIEQGAFLWYSEYVDEVEENEGANEPFDLKVSNISRKGASVTYTPPQSGHVFCGIYDTAGGLVRILASETQQGGEHTLTWDGLDSRGRKAPSGTYLIQLTIGHQQTTKKTIYLK